MTGRARRAGCGIASTRRRYGSCRGRRWRLLGMGITWSRWRIRGESSPLKPLLQTPRREVRDGDEEGDPCRRLLLGGAGGASPEERRGNPALWTTRQWRDKEDD